VIRDSLDLLLPADTATGDWWSWAQVISTDPLLIDLDGPGDPLTAVPSTLVGSLTVGDRVWVQITGRRAVVLGIGGGRAAAPRLGVVDLDDFTTSGVWAQTLNVNAAAGGHYPEPYAGLLEVEAAPGMVWQRYTMYPTRGSAVYVRGWYITDGWGPWVLQQRGTPASTATVTPTPGNGMTSSIVLERDDAGYVNARGSFGSTPTAGSPAGNGFLLCTFPVGFRPASSFNALIGSSSPTNVNCRLLSIEASGDVTCVWSGQFGGAQSTGGSGAFMTGIRFKAS